MSIDDLIDDLKSRINLAYAHKIGTESYERRQCVEAMESLRAEIASIKEERDQLLKRTEHKGFANSAAIENDIARITHAKNKLSQDNADLTQQLAAANGRVERILAAFHVNMLHAYPDKSHEEIQTEIKRACALSDLPEADKEKS